jgi:hypothetical protein
MTDAPLHASMTDPHDNDAAAHDTEWLDARRPEAWAGELRVNLVRLLAIVLFYARHLVEFYLAAPDAPVRAVYHARVTVIVLAWAAMAVALHLLLSRRRLPESLPFVAVFVDLLMVTLLCAAAGGPRTPLVLLYFLVIATAPLRLSLPIVYGATAGAMLGYLFLLGYYAWYLVGFQKYYATPELRVPRSEEAITLLALLVAGLFAGQTVRQARRLAQGSGVTVAPRDASTTVRTTDGTAAGGARP